MRALTSIFSLVFLINLIGGLASCPAWADEPPPELVKMVIDLLHERDKDMRAIGLDQVRGELKGEQTTTKFADELPKLSPEAQAGLLSALADRGDSAARGAVLQLLDASTNDEVKIAAVRALGALGETRDVLVLAKLLVADDTSLAKAARASLVRLRGEGVSQAIVEQIDAASPDVQVTLIEVLSARRALDILPELLDRAMVDTAATRMAVMTALAKLGQSQHVPAMLAGVLKAKPGRERDAAERAVVAVCERGDDPPSADELILAAWGDFSPEQQTQLLTTLGRVGGEQALAKIEDAIASDDADLREQGVRALCNWPNGTVADRIIILLMDDKFSSQCPILINALTRIAVATDGRSDAERLARLRQAMSLCETDAQRNEVLRRAQVIRLRETLHFLLSFFDQPAFTEQACLSIVELAHHRGLREPNKDLFFPALDKVVSVSKDPTTVDRAKRYKAGQTWVRPKKK